MGASTTRETGMHVNRDQQSAHGTWVRVSIAGLLAGAVVLLFHSLAPGGTATSTTVSTLAISLASGLLYVAILAPLALRLTMGLWLRLGAVFLTLYVTGTLTDLLEAYFYTTVLTPFSLAAALAFLALLAILIALLVVLVVRPSMVAWEPHGRTGLADTEHRPLADWAWRVLLAGALYVPIYYAFAAMVTPIEHAFYYDPTFIAQLHTTVPPTAVTIPLEAVRGLLFVLALLPALSVVPQQRWVSVVYLGLIGAVLEGWVPLLGLTTWPLAMRLGNLVELTGDAFGRALVVMVLLGTLGARWLPRVRRAHQQSVGRSGR
jgi:hypothetical protein